MDIGHENNPIPRNENEDSSNPLRKNEINGKQWKIWRTGSLDEANSSNSHRDIRHDGSRDGALHSSFDAALLLDKTRISGPLFGVHDDDDERLDLRSSRSFCDGDAARDITGKKHTRQLAGIETQETNLPGIVRKQPRMTAQSNACSKTPARPRLRHPGTVKKSGTATPSSAIRRRRAPFHHRKSPMRRTSLPTGHTYNFSAMSPIPGNGRIEGSVFPTANLALSPKPQTPTRGIGSNTKQSMTKWYNTGTTATTLLETTFETDSVDTSSPTTTFRFTSFPASLPRVNNPRTRQCPESVRKRMPFNETNKSNTLNQSRDDDGTHNTSISSLSAEGAHQLPPNTEAQRPPAVLELTAQVESNKGFEDADQMETNRTQPLFPYEANFGYSDDDTVGSPLIGNVGRTRLNFNELSPINDPKKGTAAAKSVPSLDLNMAYDQNQINSFQSSLSSNTHMNNLSHSEDVIATLTPARPFLKEQPSTPHDVQLHFPPETECSPIHGEDPGHFQIDQSAKVVHNPKVHKLESSQAKNESNEKEEGSIASASTTSKSRRLRPMPDMSAFEIVGLSSRVDRSGDDSATLDSKGVHSSQRLMCPPTPVRTPAWANEGSANVFFGGRQNSLITTKVLLACPSQVVEGRSSLESSVLDDDGSGSTTKLKTVGFQEQGIQPITLKNSVNVPEKDVSSQMGLQAKTPVARIPPPPRLMRRIPSAKEEGSLISFANDFDIVATLGSGAFADAYKVRSRRDGRLYAVKRNRRQFRGKRDRDMALAEVQYMQRLQNVCAENGGKVIVSNERSSYSLYLLFFYRAWQEDGYFFSQTELCCRDTCRELLDSVRLLWDSTKDKYPSLLRHLPTSHDISSGSSPDVCGSRVPNQTVWKICHDVAAGLSHIHSHGLVHFDLKPSNILFVLNPRFGAMCKIGDFGMAGDIGSQGDGQEGDARYMPPELLSSVTRQPSADIFSLGLTLYEVATESHVEMPSEGPDWHELRSDTGPVLPNSRGSDLIGLIKSMTDPSEKRRPTADDILQMKKVADAGSGCDAFLRDYILDIEEYDRMEEERTSIDHQDTKTPRNSAKGVRSPSLSMMLPSAPNLLSPVAHHLR